MLKDYLFPKTVQEAVDMLQEHDGTARIIAGGTDLFIDVNRMDPKPDYLVDLRDVTQIQSVIEDGDFILVGANATFTTIAANELVREHAAALAKGAANVGAVQVRNLGTIGGNIVSAQPAADSAVAVSALDAICVVYGPQGVREVPLLDVYEGVARSKIDSTREVLAYVKIPKRKANEQNDYMFIYQRKALSLPMVCASVKLAVEDGMVSDVRVVAAPLAPGPTRIRAVEEFLIGKPATEENFAQAGLVATEAVSFRSSFVRGSSAYRHEVLPILVRRALLNSLAGIE